MFKTEKQLLIQTGVLWSVQNPSPRDQGCHPRRHLTGVTDSPLPSCFGSGTKTEVFCVMKLQGHGSDIMASGNTGILSLRKSYFMHTRKKENRIKGRGEAAKGLVSKTTDLKAKKKKKKNMELCNKLKEKYLLADR